MSMRCAFPPHLVPLWHVGVEWDPGGRCPAGAARPDRPRTVAPGDVCLANPLRLDSVPDMPGLLELELPCLLHNLVSYVTTFIPHNALKSVA